MPSRANSWRSYAGNRKRWARIGAPTVEARHLYFSDGGDLLAMRAGHIKFQFMEQDAPGTYKVWVQEFSNLRLPIIYNLRTDPYEHGDITSNTWWSYQMHKTFYLYPAIDIAGKFLATFKEYPPRHPAASYTMSNAIDKIKSLGGGK